MLNCRRFLKIFSFLIPNFWNWIWIKISWRRFHWTFWGTKAASMSCHWASTWSIIWHQGPSCRWPICSLYTWMTTNWLQWFQTGSKICQNLKFCRWTTTKFRNFHQMPFVTCWILKACGSVEIRLKSLVPIWEFQGILNWLTFGTIISQPLMRNCSWIRPSVMSDWRGTSASIKILCSTGTRIKTMHICRSATETLKTRGIKKNKF